MNFSVIIPAYNESKNIPGLAKVIAYHPEELIIVDDGSCDDTVKKTTELAERNRPRYEAPTIRIITNRHAGKAAALITGIQAARYENLLLMDCDLSTPMLDANNLLCWLSHFDIAIGSRGIERKGAPPARYLLSWGQQITRRLLLGLDMTDTQCGCKAMRRAAALSIIDHLRVYHPARLAPRSGPCVSSGFDVEFLFVASKLGYKIREVPVTWHYRPSGRVRLVRDALRGLSDLIQIFLANLRGEYAHQLKGDIVK